MNYPAPIPGLLLAAVIEAGAVALLSWWFVFRYSRIHWKRTPEGRHLMRLTTIIGLTYTATVLSFVLPMTLLVRAIVSLVLFGAAAAEMWHRNALLHDAQHEHDDPGEE